MKQRLVLTVGNPMMGDDAAGPLLAHMMQRMPLATWDSLDGGAAPENALYLIREMKPREVLVFDAADMDLAPGAIRLIGAEKIEDPFLISTHTLPLSYLMQSLGEFVPKVQCLGIQPRLVAFGYPISPEVRQGVDEVYEALRQDELTWVPLSSRT